MVTLECTHRLMRKKCLLKWNFSSSWAEPKASPPPPPPDCSYKLCGLIMCAFLTPLISIYSMFTLGKPGSNTVENIRSGSLNQYFWRLLCVRNKNGLMCLLHAGRGHFVRGIQNMKLLLGERNCDLILSIQVPNCMVSFCEGIWRTTSFTSSLDNASVCRALFWNTWKSLYIFVLRRNSVIVVVLKQVENGFKKKSLWQRKKNPQPRVVLLAHFYRDKLFLLVIF